MRRVTRGAGSLVACAVALAGVTAGPAQSQTFDPQPYLVYDVLSEPMVPPAYVDLRDQFIDIEGVTVFERHYLMNPVNKTPVSPSGEPELITDPELHYRWHRITAPNPGTQTVWVTDQFGNRVPWEINLTPDYLLAPTSKELAPVDPGPIPVGQHYDCYPVVVGLDPNATVTLDDQFGPHGTKEVRPAEYLCAPVEKTNEAQEVFPPIPPEDGCTDHLSCYWIPPHSHIEVVNTRNQFSEVPYDEVQVLDDRLLCVPAVKSHQRVPSLAPWGIAILGLLMLLTVFWVAQRRVRYGEPA